MPHLSRFQNRGFPTDVARSPAFAGRARVSGVKRGFAWRVERDAAKPRRVELDGRNELVPRLGLAPSGAGLLPMGRKLRVQEYSIKYERPYLRRGAHIWFRDLDSNQDTCLQRAVSYH